MLVVFDQGSRLQEQFFVWERIQYEILVSLKQFLLLVLVRLSIMDRSVDYVKD